MIRRAALLSLLACFTAAAHYHWVRYSSRNGASQPIYDKFDLAALPDGRTLAYFINDPGALQLAAGDSTTALLSQIRAAAAAWNSVETAEIKLIYGGMRPFSSSVMNSPWVEVEFSDELPPGVVAMGGPTTRAEMVAGPNGVFTPITKSTLRLPRNLTNRPSWGERLFLTLVHEFGHTLGLQHSWASGVMSTELTRATTKASPISPDDAAGLSILYPSASFRRTTGAIIGRVTLNNAGVHLASVVAYSARGWAVSTLTHPDGTYRLEGLAPGAYTVYAHPLPPALAGEPQPVNLDLPTDPAGRIPPGGAFDLQFFPGTATPQVTVPVYAEQTTANISFAVRARAAVNLHSVQSYSFSGQDTLKPATMNAAIGRGTVVFSGYGATAVQPGFSVNTITPGDGAVAGSLRPYTAGYLQLDLAVAGGEGPRPLLFTLGDEQYVLPSAYTVVSRPAPVITAVMPNADRSVTIIGQNLSARSTVLFDGVAARLRSEESGGLTVLAPPAPAGHRSAISVLNPDGQSSLAFQGPMPQFYTHDAPEPGSFTISPPVLPAGAETLVEIVSSGLNLEEQPISIATGSSDVSIRRVWVTGPNRAMALASVSASAAPATSSWTIVAGLHAIAAQSPFLVVTGARQASLAMGEAARGSVADGSQLVFSVLNGPATAAPGTISVTVAERPAQVISYAAGQLTVQLPSGLSPGLAIVRVTINGEALPASAVNIASPAPQILFAVLNGNAVSPATPARAGDGLSLFVQHLYETGSTAEPRRMRLYSNLGSAVIEHSVIGAIPGSGQSAVGILQVTLSTQSAPVANLPLTLMVDDRVSPVFNLPYRQ